MWHDLSCYLIVFALGGLAGLVSLASRYVYESPAIHPCKQRPLWSIVLDVAVSAAAPGLAAAAVALGFWGPLSFSTVHKPAGLAILLGLASRHAAALVFDRATNRGANIGDAKGNVIVTGDHARIEQRKEEADDDGE